MINRKFTPIGYILFFILVYAIFIRLLGASPGYPTIHQDEPTLTEATRKLILEHNFKPDNYYYGSLLPILYAIMDIVFFIPILFLTFPFTHFDEIITGGFLEFFHYFYRELSRNASISDVSHNYFPYWTRYDTAFLSSFTVIPIYFLGKKLFNKETGLVAAFLTAINYRHVLSSNFALADAPAALFASLSILLSVMCLEKPTMKRYIYAGIGLGCAFSVKYFIYIIPAFIICHCIASWKHTRGAWYMKLLGIVFQKSIYLTIVVSVLTFVCINPFLFLDKKTASSQLAYNAMRYRLDFPTLQSKFRYPFNTLIFPDKVNVTFNYLFHYGLGEILTITIVTGIIIGLFLYPPGVFLLLSVVLPYLIIFMGISGAPVRNYSSIIPLLLLFPSLLIASLTKIIPKKNIAYVLIIGLTICIGFQSFRDSFFSSYYYSQQSNYSRFINWTNTHMQTPTTIAHGPGVPLPPNYTGNTMNFISGFYVSEQELDENKPKWVVVDSGYSTIENSLALQNPTITKDIWYMDTKQGKYLKNTFTTLTMQQLGYYRIAQFVKPFWQSIEPAVFVVTLPVFPPPTSLSKASLYSFNTQDDLSKFHEANFSEAQKHAFSITQHGGVHDSPAVMLEGNKCISPGEYRLISEKIHTSPSFYYYFSTQARRTNTPVDGRQYDGYLRLDFYSRPGEIVKTFVSKQLAENDQWQTLAAYGIAPQKSAFLTVSIQADTCVQGENYIFDAMQLLKSDQTFPVSTKQYPYYDIPIPENFIWMPEII